MKTTSILRSFITCLILLALMPVTSSSAGQATSNLAPNPSFERGRKQLVNDWTPLDTNSTFTWNKRTAYSGHRSICISNIGNFSFAEWSTSELIPVFQGNDYMFNGYAKGDFDGAAYLGIWAVDANGVITDFSRVPMSFNNTEWTFTQTSYRPAAGTVAVRLSLSADDLNPDPTGTGMICFDYVSLEAFPYAMP